MALVTRLGWLAFGLALVVVGVDQTLKHWIVHDLGLSPFESRPVLWPVSFTLVRNDGISFGFFQTHAPWTRWALSAFALAMSAVLVMIGRRADRPVTAIALGLVLGGALGNLLDRLTTGAVIDFIDVHLLFFPWIFNLADAGITIGAILWIGQSLLTGSRDNA